MVRTLLFGVLVLTLLPTAGCADDGTDGALFNRRVSEQAAALRASVITQRPGSRDASPEPVPAAAPVGDTTIATTAQPTGVVVPVIALDNSFRPEVVEIDVGDEVLWENRGLNEHDVLHVEGEGWGVDVHNFQPGAVYAHVFDEPGEYRYYCSIHGNETVGMVGTVIVR